MRTIQTWMNGVANSTVWPAYIGLAAYAARQAPWPRCVAIPTATALLMLALAALAANLIRWFFGQGGRAPDVLGMTPEVSRQVRLAALAVVAAHLVFLLPVWMLGHGLLAPGGRPVSAPGVVRGLILAFELGILVVAFRLLRRRSPLVVWLTEAPARLGRLARYQRAVSAAVLGGIAAVIALDARGYSFSARRLASGAVGSLAVGAVCWGIYRVLARLIDEQAWRWIKVGPPVQGRDEPDGAAPPADLAVRLRRLSGYFAAAVGVFLAAWVWDIDLALFRFLAGQPLWPVDAQKTVWVNVGDLTKSALILAACAVIWRHMSTFFAVVVFPKISDDPGVRFAIVTLCRYAVLAVGLLGGLSVVHLGLEKIGVVLAALGVGLGFGLQEIVSNFVCGLILLLERPIRVGDVVTVAGMSGKVDRINIRATTIINGDNQSIIVPNRAFITSDLVNWTLKDKVIRVSCRVKVAHGTDPDKVSEQLLAIARDDADVLRNPLPAALLEEISDSSLVFVLHVHVPEPSLSGRVKHRLFRQIQTQFAEAGIPIAVPTQELLFKPLDPSAARTLPTPANLRADPPSGTPPAPRVFAPRRTPEPVEDCHRGVDE